MEITKLSTKGQIVIPESMRKNLEVGAAFNVARKGDLIILKEIEGLSEEDLEFAKRTEEAWKEYEKGNSVNMDFDDFIKEIKKW